LIAVAGGDPDAASSPGGRKAGENPAAAISPHVTKGTPPVRSFLLMPQTTPITGLVDAHFEHLQTHGSLRRHEKKESE
jgi:hypothetical protein